MTNRKKAIEMNKITDYESFRYLESCLKGDNFLDGLVTAIEKIIDDAIYQYRGIKQTFEYEEERINDLIDGAFEDQANELEMEKEEFEIEYENDREDLIEKTTEALSSKIFEVLDDRKLDIEERQKDIYLDLLNDDLEVVFD